LREEPKESWSCRSPRVNPSPDALGVVRSLPTAFAAAALHPPVVPARAVPNLLDDPEESRMARVTVLALPRVAEGGRVKGVEPSTMVGGKAEGRRITPLASEARWSAFRQVLGA
jgi:hypothetical protein